MSMGASLRLMTMREVAEALGRSELFVRRLVVEGILPARRIGRRWYVAEPELIDWLGGRVEPRGPMRRRRHAPTGPTGRTGAT